MSKFVLFPSREHFSIIIKILKAENSVTPIGWTLDSKECKWNDTITDIGAFSNIYQRVSVDFSPISGKF